MAQLRPLDPAFRIDRQLQLRRRRSSSSTHSNLRDIDVNDCFVIAENSDTRGHADDVFDFIIAPAAERAGYTAKRGDHPGAPGKIAEQMFRSIL